MKPEHLIGQLSKFVLTGSDIDWRFSTYWIHWILIYE